MIVFPNCKINLGLQVFHKREDGFHHLETVFYPVPLRDALETVSSSANKQQTEISFKTTGLIIEGESQNNLCIKAYKLLKKDFPTLPHLDMHLHKIIPMGAGLGGGSSDGAFALKLMNDKFQLGLSTQQLMDYALQLGSDCPFFILNKPSYATGRGEILEPVELDLSAYRFALVNPLIHVNTGWAFANLNLSGLNLSGRLKRPDSEKRLDLKTIIQQPISTWKNQLINDFEEPVFKQYPEIASIKQQLYNAGAVYASMTGSGSTVFGIFSKAQEPLLSFPPAYFYRLI